jgi:ABC-type glycerol-3-phosphate transport system permease component
MYNSLYLLTAASTLVLLLVLVAFFPGQKYFVNSIVMTSVKG